MNYQDFQAPNLDDIDVGETHRWATIFGQLSNIAASLAKAKEYRLAGQVHLAVQHEKAADVWYSALPQEVKW